jgi:microcystin-dependent protein
MSSSGIDAISSGPLIIRTYNNSGSSDVTYVLRDYDYPVSSNYVLITSTNGQLVPSDNIYVSSITTSSFNSDYIRASTAYLSSVFGFSPVQFYSPVRINNNPQTSDVQLFVNGSTVFSEPGAQSTAQIAGVNIFGLPNGNTINTNFTNSTLYTINEPVTKLNFQLIGAGGSNVNGNNALDFDQPGIGAYISGTLAVKQGDKLQIFTGTVGDASNGSKGTSLIYLSSVGGGVFVSTLVCVAGAGGGNGWAVPLTISSSSGGGGHGGGSNNGGVTTVGNVDYISFGIGGYDGINLINGNYKSFADGGGGGLSTIGGAGGDGGGGANGGDGAQPNLNNLLTTGGLVNGGAGGSSSRIGGYGGGGYSGGGGGGASTTVSGGGGGGATYIATSTLSNYLSNLVCLGGQWISENNATPFGGDYGKANNPGYVAINGYEPNDTLYTNGDIECRVLRYEMLDPPINAIGGSSALWSLYPSIDIVHMNDNPIVECGGIEIKKGGITVSNFIDIIAGTNDSDVAPGGFMSKFIRTASSGTQTIDYQVAGDSTEFGDRTWQDARYVYNSQDAKYSLRPVWGIVTSSNITPVGSTIGDIHFYNSVYVDGNVGIGVPPVSATEQLTVWSTILVRGQENSSSRLILGPSPSTTNYDYCSMIEAVNYQTTHFSSDLRFYTHGEAPTYGMPTERMRLDQFGNVGIGTITPTTNLQVIGTVSTNNFVTSSILTNATSLNISSAETSTLGNLTVTGTLNSIDIPPVGAINMYAGLTDPPGWMICDGREISRTITYNTLFTVIGTTFGSGDGLTTFNIPDMRNRFAVGVGTGYSMGSTGGFVSTTLDSTQIPSHTHPVTDPGHGHRVKLYFQTTDTDSGDGGGIEWDNDTYGRDNSVTFDTGVNQYTAGNDTYFANSGNAGSNTNYAMSSFFNSTGITIGNNPGGGQPFDNRPPFFGINYIIKY